MKEKDVGSSQKSTEKDNLENRIDKLANLGKTKGKTWNKQRRYKSV